MSERSKRLVALAKKGKYLQEQSTVDEKIAKTINILSHYKLQNGNVVNENLKITDNVDFNKEVNNQSIIIEEIPYIAEEANNGFYDCEPIHVNGINHNLPPESNKIEASNLYDKLDHNDLSDKEEVEKTKNKNYKDKRDFCFFCEKDVSHFSRHLLTWHPNEVEVQRIFSYERKSKARRNLLSSLRKRGNFIRNRNNIKLRPVKRSNKQHQPVASDFLPCPHCYGFYKKKSLFRHTKLCTENTVKDGKRQNAQSQGQTTLLMGTLIKHDELLKKELFPHMRADEVTLIAKKDLLICYYGYSYLKGRRSKGNLDLVRQNMRRLGKLIQFARMENIEIKDLIDLLRPCHFQTIINCVNKIACYNAETDIYESPTVAMNFGTLIKKCCDLAHIHLLQKSNSEQQRKELKILKTLVQSQWADEVSAQALSNLNMKKWNKDELLPLTSDLRKLNIYLKKGTEEAFNQLVLDETNVSAYNSLKEMIYVQIILLNRRRPAEVAQLTVNTYKSIDLNTEGEREFENCLTETEKVLLKSYSRIVIRGKRGRGVPILLPEGMKKNLDFLINKRNNFVKKNEFIFHTSGQSFIDGTKIIYKYALKCGVQNPKSISATRLRKHLATVTQLLNFSEKDLEQLSKFMGHTLNIHCSVYRLSDNMYQTAKVSKLLLLAMEGGVEQYKGMQLDDIDIALDAVSDNTDFINDLGPDSDSEDIVFDKPSTTTEAVKINKRLPKPRNPWSIEHKTLIANYFSKQIKCKQAPKQLEVEAFMDKYPEVCENRAWTTIKAVVFNIYTGKLNV